MSNDNDNGGHGGHGGHCTHQDRSMMFPVSPLSWLQCGLLVDFIQDLQYLGQVVLGPLEFWLWLRWSLELTEPPANVDVISSVLQDTLWASCHFQGVDVNLVIIINVRYSFSSNNVNMSLFGRLHSK